MLVLSLVGCSSDDDDATLGQVQFPQVIDEGGPTIASPVVVPIFAENDPLQAGYERFLAKVAPSAYWRSIGADYGIGPITLLPSVVLPGPPPTSLKDEDIPALLASNVAAGVLPAPTASTIYFLYPSSATTTTYFGDIACLSASAWHESGTANGQTFTYAVQPTCGTTDLDTNATVHELIEAATDAEPNVATGYATTDDPAGEAWAAATGGGQEVADLCDDHAALVPPEIGAEVPRVWSTSRLAAGHNPCVEVETDPYPYFGGAIDGFVTLAPGDSTTVSVQLFSPGPLAGPFRVQVVSGSPNLTFSLDRSEGRVGDVLALTIRRATASDEADIPFGILSSYGDVEHIYYALVED